MAFEQKRLRERGIDELYSIERGWRWQRFRQQRREWRRQKPEDKGLGRKTLVSYNCLVQRRNRYSRLPVY